MRQLVGHSFLLNLLVSDLWVHFNDCLFREVSFYALFSSLNRCLLFRIDLIAHLLLGVLRVYGVYLNFNFNGVSFLDYFRGFVLLIIASISGRCFNLLIMSAVLFWQVWLQPHERVDWLVTLRSGCWGFILLLWSEVWSRAQRLVSLQVIDPHRFELLDDKLLQALLQRITLVDLHHTLRSCMPFYDRIVDHFEKRLHKYLLNCRLFINFQNLIVYPRLLASFHFSD